MAAFEISDLRRKVIISLNDAKAKIRSGSADEVIGRYIVRTLSSYFSAIRGDPLKEGLDDALVVALILKKALQLKEFRQMLRLKRLPRGPAFCIDDFIDIPAANDAALVVAERYSSGEISREFALSELESIVFDFYGQSPKDGKTMDRLLNELVERAQWLDQAILGFVDLVADGDREKAEQIAKELAGK